LKISGRRVEWYETLDSTMTVAARLAREGCEHGTAVVADEQTAGIGRQGRSWHSEKGTGLYVSIVLRLGVPRLPQTVPVTMLALGLAAREAIAQTSGLAPDLRWPNDVLIGGRKCAGMLAQLEGGALIAGIGINVAQANFPIELDATSLLMEGATVSREDVLVALVEAVDEYCGKEPVEIRRLFEGASSYARGLRVRVEQNGVEGVTQGLDASGFLIVKQDNGEHATILAGGVRPCC
jgi:BirA family transcriptional regulator, biotin operon repressor / biotin---[acetyl-CoA-carboxylase] ligase